MDNLTQQLHVWYLWLDTPSCLERPLQWQEWLLPTDLKQYHAYIFERDRRRYVWTRWLLRRVLSHYTGLDPMAWVFETNAYGRPQIKQPASPLHFNLSHTATAIVCLIGLEYEIGIDIEDTTRKAPLEIAEHFFAPQEHSVLQAHPIEQQPALFWKLWTLKEAYIKARGMGLSLALEKFAFQIMNDSIQLKCDASLEDDETCWDFSCYDIGKTWHASIAQRVHKGDQPRSIIWHNARQFLSDQEN